MIIGVHRLFHDNNWCDDSNIQTIQDVVRCNSFTTHLLLEDRRDQAVRGYTDILTCLINVFKNPPISTRSYGPSESI